MAELFLVNRYKIGEKITVFRRLSTEEVLALQHVFIEKEYDNKDSDIALSLADTIRGKVWLSCACNPTNAALMTIGLSEKNHFYLQRMNSRGAHQKECPFGQTKTAYFDIASVTEPFKAKKILGLCRRGKINETNDQKANKNTRRRASIPMYKLSRLLYSLIELSELNIIDGHFPASYDYHKNFEKLIEKTKDFFLDKKISLKNFFWKFPNIDEMVQRLNAAYYWPKTSRPHAVCVAIAQRIQENKIYFFKESLEVKIKGEIKQSSGYLTENSGPFLVIFVVTDTEEEAGIFLPRQAFYVPTYSGNTFLPVDSTYERKVLSQLIAIVQNCKKLGYHVTIKKPLFIEKKVINGDLQFYKPDFEIQTPTLPIYIEVMGLNDEAYKERKKKTIACMEEAGKVVIFDATDSNNFDQNLRELKAKLESLIKQSYNKTGDNRCFNS